MKMKLGCTPRAIQRGSFEDALKLISEIGFEYVEVELMDGACIFIDYGFCPILPFDISPKLIKRKVSRYGLKISAVCAHSRLLVPQGLPTYGVPQVKKAIRYANEIQVPIVIISEGKKSIRMSDSEAWKLLEYHLGEIVSTAEDYGIMICVEPHGSFSTNADGLKKIMGMYPSQHLAINFDIGNVFAAGNDPVSTLCSVVHWTKHMHMKDVGFEIENGRRKMKVAIALGDGEIDIKGIIDVLKEAEFGGILGVETPRGPEDARKSYEFLKSII